MKHKEKESNKLPELESNIPTCNVRPGLDPEPLGKDTSETTGKIQIKYIDWFMVLCQY